MKTSGIKHLLLVLYILFSFNYIFCQNHNSVPIANDRDKSFVTIRVGNITISKILLDTGFDFDGIIIYNPAYRDSIDLSGAFPVSLGGAGDTNPVQFPILEGPYLGLKHPDSIPLIFAPGIISSVWGLHSSLAFSPDGEFIIFLSGREGESHPFWVSAKIIEELRPKRAGR